MANPVEIEFDGKRVSSTRPMPVGYYDTTTTDASARDGYFRAGEEAREDLVAAGKWHRLPLAPCASAEVDCEITEAFIEAGLAPIKRRGRPPKVADGTEEGQRRARVLM